MSTIGRKDAWWAALTEEQCWTLYSETRQMTWFASVERARAMLGTATAPSRSAWYRFEAAMRQRELAHRIELAAQARAEAKKLADGVGAAGETAKAFLAMATEIAMRTGDAAAAESWTRQAAALYQAAARNRGLAIRAEASRLARDKFEAQEKRLNAIRDAATVKPGETLTPEERLEKVKQIFGIQ